MLKKLAEYVDREVEIWTQENTEPWMGILKEVTPEFVTIDIDQIETMIVPGKIVAFRLSEGEQGAGGSEAEESS
jgi:hypothetical protein